jgi:hypothetical protein
MRPEQTVFVMYDGPCIYRRSTSYRQAARRYKPLAELHGGRREALVPASRAGLHLAAEHPRTERGMRRPIWSTALRCLDASPWRNKAHTTGPGLQLGRYEPRPVHLLAADAEFPSRPLGPKEVADVKLEQAAVVHLIGTPVGDIKAQLV